MPLHGLPELPILRRVGRDGRYKDGRSQLHRLQNFLSKEILQNINPTSFLMHVAPVVLPLPGIKPLRFTLLDFTQRDLVSH